jgi:hypothetical protein
VLSRLRMLSPHGVWYKCRMPPMSTAICLLMAVMLSMWSTSCTTVTQASVSVQEDSNRFIRLEGRYGDERRDRATRFEHPLPLTITEWERLLSSIQVQSRKDTFLFTTAKNPPEPAFTPEQIIYLSSGLQEGFARAHPDEFVVFGFSEVRAPQLTEITTGGWFVYNNQLHLILANYRHSVSMKHIREQLWQDPLHSNTSPSYEILPGPNQKLERGQTLGGMLSADAPELIIDYKPLLATPPAPPSWLSPESAPKGSPSATPPASASIEEKLRALKNLRDQGLISEDEYRDKKKQLLDRL